VGQWRGYAHNPKKEREVASQREDGYSQKRGQSLEEKNLRGSEEGAKVDSPKQAGGSLSRKEDNNNNVERKIDMSPEVLHIVAAGFLLRKWCVRARKEKKRVTKSALQRRGSVPINGHSARKRGSMAIPERSGGLVGELERRACAGLRE